MVNGLSYASIILLTFGKCFINGQLDIKKYPLYLLVKKKEKKISNYKIIPVSPQMQILKNDHKKEEDMISEEAQNLTS